MSDLFTPAIVSLPMESQMGAPPFLDVKTPRSERVPIPAAVTATVPMASRPRATPARRRRIAPILTSAAALALVWAALNPGDTGSWIVGAPCVMAGALIYGALTPAARARISWLGAARFAGYFAVQATRGAIDVALRALLPRLRVDPGFVEIDVGLPAGAGRILFANTLSLLPGTLTAELRGGRAIIHVIDRRADIGREIDDLRRRVRTVFPKGREA